MSRQTAVQAAQRLRTIAREDRIGAATRKYRAAQEKAAQEAQAMPNGTAREQVAREDHQRVAQEKAAAAYRSVVESVTRDREQALRDAGELDATVAGSSDVATIERGRDYWARTRGLLDAGVTSARRLISETDNPEELAVLARELPAYVAAQSGPVPGSANGGVGIARAMAGKGDRQDWIAESAGRRLAEFTRGADGDALRAVWDRDDAVRVLDVDLDHATSLLDGRSGSGSALTAAMATQQARAHADGLRREAGQRPLIAEAHAQGEPARSGA